MQTVLVQIKWASLVTYLGGLVLVDLCNMDDFSSQRIDIGKIVLLSHMQN